MNVTFGGGELAVIGTLLGGMVTALVFVHKLMMAAKDAAIADMRSDRDNYKSIAADAVRMMEASLARQRAIEHTQGVKPLAAVRPEHSSPVTPKQRIIADQATLRALVVAAALELGLPGRLNHPDDAAESMVSKADAIAAVLAIPPGQPEKMSQPVCKDAVVAAVMCLPVSWTAKE